MMGTQVTSANETDRPPRFELRGELGRGAMGIVYEAFDREKQREVALKTIRNPEPEKVLRLKREFRALRDLHHRNLVQLGELIEEGGNWLFTMELVRGTSFLQYVWEREPIWAEEIPGRPPTPEPGARRAASPVPPTAATVDLPLGSSPVRSQLEVVQRPVVDEDRLRHALRELATGLVALHSAGKVHRDIKPSNILVDHKGRVVLVDFGVVAELTAQVDGGRLIGTPPYMAPEQVERKAVSPAADWYAVGSVLFEALTGQPPFKARTPGELLDLKLEQPARRPSELVPSVPADLDDLCRALLRRSPDERPGEDQILAALGAAPTELVLGGARRRANFVGRRAELSILAEAWHRARDGRAAAVSIEGPSGIGKTSLAEEFAAEVVDTDRKALVLRGRCHAQERIPYNGLDGVIDQLANHLETATWSEGIAVPHSRDLLKVFPSLGLVPSLTASASADSPRGTGLEIRNQAFAALRELLQQVAAVSPVLCLLDDLHWADVDSRAALQELTQGKDAPPILWIATLRAGGDGSSDLAADALQADRTRLQLEGLSESDATQLAVDLGGDDALSAAVARETGGHPLFIEEMVRDLAARGVGVRLDEALYGRARELPGHALRVLEPVAVAGRAVAQEVVREALDLDATSFERAVESLRQASLVRVRGTGPADLIECFHDRVREAVYERIPEARRAKLHGGLAAILEKRGAAAEDLFDHFRCAGLVERALDCAEVAAARARGSLAFGRAAEIYRSALELGIADEGRRREVWVQLAEALKNDDHPRDAADAYRHAAGLAEGDAAAELRRRASMQLLVGGYVREGMELISEVAARVGVPLPTSKARILAGVLVAQLRLRTHSLTWKTRAESDIPRSELAPIDVCWALGSGLYMVDIPLGAYFTTRGALLALRVGEPYRIARALGAASLGTGAMGRHAQTRRLIAASKRAAEESGSPIASFYAHLTDTLAYFTVDNNFARCLESLRGVLDEWGRAGRGPGWETDNIEHFWCSCLLATFRGDRFLRRVGARGRAAKRSGNRFSELTFRVRFMGPYHLWNDEPDKAWEDVSEALAQWRAEREDFGNQRLWGLWSLTQIAVYQGETDARAEELLAEWKRAERSLIGRVAIMRGMSMLYLGGFWLSRARLAASRNDTDAAERHRRQALRCAKRLDRNPEPFSTGIAAALRATVAFQRGDRERAIELLEFTYAWVMKTGPDGFSSIAQYRLGQLREDRRGAQLRAAVGEWLGRGSVVDAERWIECWLPGWYGSVH